MLKKSMFLPMAGAAVAAVVSMAAIGATPSSADKGGCPNAASANGAAHANANSAHSHCQESSPPATPTPAPTPPPLPEADVRVVVVYANAPATAFANTPFTVSSSAGLMNNGPTDGAIVDVTFMPTLPSDCSATFGAVTVQDRVLPMGSSVSISRSWSVTCSQAGSHMFRFDVSVAIDSAQAMTDPNLANNSGAGSDTTQTN